MHSLVLEPCFQIIMLMTTPATLQPPSLVYVVLWFYPYSCWVMLSTKLLLHAYLLDKQTDGWCFFLPPKRWRNEHRMFDQGTGVFTRAVKIAKSHIRVPGFDAWFWLLTLGCFLCRPCEQAVMAPRHWVPALHRETWISSQLLAPIPDCLGHWRQEMNQ